MKDKLTKNSITKKLNVDGIKDNIANAASKFTGSPQKKDVSKEEWEKEKQKSIR